MQFGPLDNYIEMHRRKVGLTQGELAFLIGIEERTMVGRYEQGLRFPNLEVLLALEMVLGENSQDLFAGVALKVQDNIRSRARTLLESLDDTPSREMVLKLELLSKLARPNDISIIPLWEPEE